MSGTDCDVIVVGGGMVGSAVACLLAGEGLQIAVIEADGEPQFEPDDDVGLRVSAVSPASRRLLKHLDAWSVIERARDGNGASGYEAMHVWDASTPADSAAALHFDCAEIGEPNLGHIVENKLIAWALSRQLAASRRVAIFAPARLKGLEAGERGVSVQLDDGRELSARLVVGADGAASMTRECAGIEVSGWPYGQRALVTHVATELPHQRTAWQRFLPDGPLALLPLADGRCSVVWSTKPELAEELQSMDAGAFDTRLSQASDHVLGALQASEAKASFPLRLQHAKCYTKSRVALVGDAVHSVHPLAGQGLNMGFLDAAALAEVIGDGVKRGHDIGDPVVLRNYERWRKGHNVAMMGSLDLLKRLFGAEHEGVRLMRSLGLGWVNASVPVKRRIMRAAVDGLGRLPRVLQAVEPVG